MCTEEIEGTLGMMGVVFFFLGHAAWHAGS